MSEDKPRHEYLYKLPKVVPVDRVLVHNQVYPVARRPGTRGSRCWLALPNPEKLVACDCGWAPELGQHFVPRQTAINYPNRQAPAKKGGQP